MKRVKCNLLEFAFQQHLEFRPITLAASFVSNMSSKTNFFPPFHLFWLDMQCVEVVNTQRTFATLTCAKFFVRLNFAIHFESNEMTAQKRAPFYGINENTSLMVFLKFFNGIHGERVHFNVEKSFCINMHQMSLSHIVY